jgi:sugar-specific transcriptional regulator TrmB
VFLKGNTKTIGDDMEAIEALINFGLTRQEATIYLALVGTGELTGYEVSKHTGISRSNAYTGLAGLVEKGAAYVIEGSVTRYTAVDALEFCNNKIRQLDTIKTSLIKNMPLPIEDEEGYITIKGEKHIVDKMWNMLEQVQSHLYIVVSGKILEALLPQLKQLVANNMKVVIITKPPFQLDGAIVYNEVQSDENQIRLITDSKIVLTGEITQGENSTCLYSKKKNLVDLFKEALKNEIKLIELENREEN